MSARTFTGCIFQIEEETPFLYFGYFFILYESLTRDSGSYKNNSKNYKEVHQNSISNNKIVTEDKCAGSHFNLLMKQNSLICFLPKMCYRKGQDLILTISSWNDSGKLRFHHISIVIYLILRVISCLQYLASQKSQIYRNCC